MSVAPSEKCLLRKKGKICQTCFPSLMSLTMRPLGKLELHDEMDGEASPSPFLPPPAKGRLLPVVACWVEDYLGAGSSPFLITTH